MLSEADFLELEAELLEEIEHNPEYGTQTEGLHALRIIYPRASLIIEYLLLMKEANTTNEINALAAEAHYVTLNSLTFLPFESMDMLHTLIVQSQGLETEVLQKKILVVTEPINYRSH